MSENDTVRVMRIIARMNVGGPAWQSSVLTRGLDADRFETRLLIGATTDDEADFVALRDPSLPVVPIRGLGRSPGLLDDLRAIFGICREIQRFRPHIVHTHTAKAGVLGRIAAIASRVPIRVHTFHGHVLRGYFSPLVTRLIRIVERLLARSTTALISVGKQVQDDLLAYGIGRPEAYVVVPPGVGPSEEVERSDARRMLELPDCVPVAMFVGRLTAIKRVDRLLEAFALVLERVPEAILAIAGEGDLLDGLRIEAEPLGESVRFLGWQAEVSPLYAAADLVVISSDNEGMPVTLIEAAMAGTPGVTTDVGSAAEVVEDGVTGRVVSADAAALAKAMTALFTDEDARYQMGEQAAVRAKKYFGVERLVADHERLYERLLTP
ncbi:MAG: glycosyltransferase [Acidimicrobiales bacterium]|nr:glycosyltransferase [Acidimicrobiales bacterium]